MGRSLCRGTDIDLAKAMPGMDFEARVLMRESVWTLWARSTTLCTSRDASLLTSAALPEDSYVVPFWAAD